MVLVSATKFSCGTAAPSVPILSQTGMRGLGPEYCGSKGKHNVYVQLVNKLEYGLTCQLVDFSCYSSHNVQSNKVQSTGGSFGLKDLCRNF
jgi:hypothetical protein